GAMLRLGVQNEAGILSVPSVLVVIVVVDPGGQPSSKLLDEGQGHFLETLARTVGSKGQVENDDLAGEITSSRKLARCGKNQIHIRRSRRVLHEDANLPVQPGRRLWEV
ncbi:MAG: hypothetical protein U1E22_06200, partial [Coriobacteriia bacterium]|nr:hypothetical protein [Coriobacteriia bacterium]